MNALSISNLSGFIARYPEAWEVFARLQPNMVLDSFGWEQDGGSWVARDITGSRSKFRVYGEQVIAVSTPTGTILLRDGAEIEL